MAGYQEILTDPSYKGQFVVFTYPHLGNVGINPGDMESSKVHLGGVIARDYSLVVSNYRANTTLDAYLKAQGVLGIADVDTRAITRRLRVTGCLNGAICTDASVSDADLVASTKAWSIVGQDLIREVTCAEPYDWSERTEGEWEFAAAARAAEGGAPLHVVAYDYGVKRNILRRLASFGCRVTVVPADFPAADVLAMDPDGVFFSNGRRQRQGDPRPEARFRHLHGPPGPRPGLRRLDLQAQVRPPRRQPPDPPRADRAHRDLGAEPQLRCRPRLAARRRRGLAREPE
jgi:carbamoyl-phosphate synthase small subunit